MRWVQYLLTTLAIIGAAACLQHWYQTGLGADAQVSRFEADKIRFAEGKQYQGEIAAAELAAVELAAVELAAVELSAEELFPLARTPETLSRLERTNVAPAANWSASRRQNFHTDPGQEVIAVIDIQSLNIRAPVYSGTSDTILDAGVGWIPGTTALPNEASNKKAGNIGLAAHRDSFFRNLQDAKIGDRITVSTKQDSSTYLVDSIKIVDPSDVSVLAVNEGKSWLTLVTCHPFYFVGSAPNRYIVRAVLEQSPVEQVQLLSSAD